MDKDALKNKINKLKIKTKQSSKKALLYVSVVTIPFGAYYGSYKLKSVQEAVKTATKPDFFDQKDIAPKSLEDFYESGEKAKQELENNDNLFYAPKNYNLWQEAFNKTYGTDIDVNDPQIRKLYIASKGISGSSIGLGDQYALDREKGFTSDGIYGAGSFLLGIDAAAHHQLQHEKDPAYVNFARELYTDNARLKMFPEDQQKQAENICQQLFEKRLQEYDICQQDTGFIYGKGYKKWSSCVHTEFEDTLQKSDWHQGIYIDTTQLRGPEYFSPIAATKLHELAHVMQSMPGGDAFPFSRKDKSVGMYDFQYLSELAPMIEEIVIQDQVYKKINHIDLDQEVEYTPTEKNKINLGKIANDFRNLKEKTGLRSYEDVLLTPEAHQLVYGYMHTNEHQNNLSKHIKTAKNIYFLLSQKNNNR